MCTLRLMTSISYTRLSLRVIGGGGDWSHRSWRWDVSSVNHRAERRSRSHWHLQAIQSHLHVCERLHERTWEAPNNPQVATINGDNLVLWLFSLEMDTRLSPMLNVLRVTLTKGLRSILHEQIINCGTEIKTPSREKICVSLLCILKDVH